MDGGGTAAATQRQPAHRAGCIRVASWLAVSQCGPRRRRRSGRCRRQGGTHRCDPPRSRRPLLGQVPLAVRRRSFGGRLCKKHGAAGESTAAAARSRWTQRGGDHRSVARDGGRRGLRGRSRKTTAVIRRAARSHPPAGRSTPRQDAGDSQIGGGSNQRKPGGSEQMSFLVDANRRRRKRSHTHAKIRPPYLTRISAYLRVSLRIWPPQRAQIRSSGAVSGGIWLPPVAQIRADTRRYSQIRARYARPSAPFSCAKHVISERPHRLRNLFLVVSSYCLHP